MRDHSGFSLVGTIVGVAVFSIISFSVYGGFYQILNGIQVLRIKNLAIAIANEQIEIARNLNYEDVGIVNGLPAGVISREQNQIRDGIEFKLVASVRDVDDEFDGTIGGDPNDSYASDYKIVQFDINCSNCVFTEKLNFFTIVSPKDLSVDGDGGALFINVLNAYGEPVSAADIYVYSDSGDSLIDIIEVTDNKGLFKIVNAPPGVEKYEIVVKKSGHSTEKTYQVGGLENPAPNNPHATVIVGNVTNLTFKIDELSDLEMFVRDEFCQTPDNVGMNLKGAKMIGYENYKVDTDFNIENGLYKFEQIEWDDYQISSIDDNYEIVGFSHSLPLALNPGTFASSTVTVVEKTTDSNSLLLQIIDSQTKEFISQSKVTLSKNSFSTSSVTGLYNYLDESFVVTATTGEYISDTIDLGASFEIHELNWVLNSEPIDFKQEMVKFQIAFSSESNPIEGWNYLGPDKTPETFFESSDLNAQIILESPIFGEQYVRYKILLNPEKFLESPIFDSLGFKYRYGCTPAGQKFFSDLDDDIYELKVEKEGYQTYLVTDFSVTNGWQMQKIILNKE